MARVSFCTTVVFSLRGARRVLQITLTRSALWSSFGTPTTPSCRPRDGDLRRDVAPRSMHVVLKRSRRTRTSTAWRYPRPPASSAALEPLESQNILWPADADPRSARPRHLLSPRPQNDASGAARHLSRASCCRRAANVTRTVGRSAPTPNQPDRHSATPRPSYETSWHGPALFDGPGAVAEP